jgi:cytochrome c peroxidase
MVVTLGSIVAGLLGPCDEGLAQTVTPRSARAAARAAGLDSLATVPIPRIENLAEFLKPDVASRRAAVRLGKALFWDMQVGSDGQACGSCHFHAFADNRAKNQLSPGLKNVQPAKRNRFDPTGSGSTGGPNYTLKEADFPFHVLADAEESNYLRRQVLFDTDDVASSQGVFAARFEGVEPKRPDDRGKAFPDLVFNVAGVNVRRVEPRNTPTIVNAVFNHSNFWDGRAHNLFNGASVLGPLDPDARVFVTNGGSLARTRVRIPNASLASQAVGPPVNTSEMAFFDRPFPEVGRKLLGLRPLGLQLVHPRDSVLGPLARGGNRGLSTSYAELIKQAFQPKYWDSRAQVRLNGPSGLYSQMEANFALFFGLAIQMYESTLVSQRTPFDRFMAGDDRALEPEQLHGLLVFLNRGRPTNGPSRNPPEVDAAIRQSGLAIGAGNCVGCHGGPEFTDAAITSLSEDSELELIELEETPVLTGGLLRVSPREGLLDNGFSNIGVRPTDDDLGRGGTENGLPLSFARLALAGRDDLLPDGAELPCAPGGCPGKVQVDGAFKVPGLRNVELTGPYFHNGGQATLGQVVEFYDRQADFADRNIADVDRNLAFVDLSDVDEEPLVEFLLALTDDRVRNERAPFDRPQILVPNGHLGNRSVIRCLDDEVEDAAQACDDLLTISAVGAGGRPAAGLRPLGNFLGLEHVD